ncbi:MAG: hypothetical protein RLN75_04525, partial [Longimicrobiales bacterium]
MIHPIAILIVVTAAPPIQADTVGVVKALRDDLGYLYYREVAKGPRGRPRLTWEEFGQANGWSCEADEGDDCFRGDPDDSACASGLCLGSREPLFERIVRSAVEVPESGFLIGQGVYAMTKQCRLLEAMELVESCRAAPWWCLALRGLVLHEAERHAQANDVFDSAVAAAPPEVTCDWTDATWLLGGYPFRRSAAAPEPAFRRPWQEAPCETREAATDTVLWLGDPLYVVDGNDRRTEFLANGIRYRLGQEISDARPAADAPEDMRANRRASTVRRGPWDSWMMPRIPPDAATARYLFTSKKAARYHFVPDFEGEGFGKPSWRLMAEFEDEGYTPPYAPFYELPLQIARFRASADTMQRVAT